MPITHTIGATTLTGDSIDFFQLAVMTSYVGLECKGIRLHRGPVLWKRAKVEYGLTGNKHAVYAQLCALRDELRTKQEHVTVEHGRTVREVGGQEVQ